ncbi:hypothetical protein O181_020653 [Austropuccinia psidii MF-1]|uniref:Uncharacterized protein n=1 Tax=Austropuccinia psidii MF-1 TaxID=1389203 RepID=A0A9Q3GUQ3_9BASI|nr:hypothetical protein [Austropuccinia psidii MF-1]
MSSSKPHRSRLGSVHDSDSQSRIEYVQTQSPMSPKNPLTTPIASSMNVSGLNNDVVNLTAQTSSTWSIPITSVTPIPPNPTNTQMHASERSGSTPEISSKANRQSKFACELLLNPCQNSVMSQEPFGPSKQPTLNIPSGSQVHVGGEKQASKARTAHASSSREKIMDDEDENMSPSHSETNDEPRRDNFMAHEEGTQSNSELTNPQMPLAQSMLEQPEVRYQRNQACKACKAAKSASQKEQQRWLKAELPENLHGMESAVHAHCLFLLKLRDKDFSSLPAPPSTEECEVSIQVAGHLGYVPKDVFNEPSTQVQSQVFQSYCKNELHKLGLKKFTWDWESLWQHPFKKLMSMMFYPTFRIALVSTKYHHYCWNKDDTYYGVVAALMKQYFTYLKREWKSI